jgi:hypothetical protein
MGGIARRTFLKNSARGGAAMAALLQGANTLAQGGREDAPMHQLPRHRHARALGA